MPAGDTYAEFYIHPWLNVAESRKEGHHVYEDRVWIEIKVKGDHNASFSREKKDSDEQTYPEAWAKFKGQEIESKGTPLRVLPSISPAAEKNMSAMGVNTVEDLAQLKDAHVIGFRGMIKFRQEAQAYLAAMDDDFMSKLKEDRDPRKELEKELAQKLEIVGSLKKTTNLYKQYAQDIEDLTQRLEAS